MMKSIQNRRYGHVHYRALPKLNQMVSGVPQFLIGHEGVCKGCALGKNIKKPFPSSDNISKEALDLILLCIWFDACEIAWRFIVVCDIY